jgi:putative glutamine transport system substrate-binding protein
MKNLIRFCSAMCLGYAFLLYGAEGGAENHLDKIKERGYLIVGIRVDSPMMGYLDPKTNQNKGFDPDLARALAKEILKDSSKVKFVVTPSGNRVGDITDDKVDLMIQNLTINDERKKVIDFSNPYYTSGQVVLVKKGSIKKIEDLAGKKIATIGATTNTKFLQNRIPSVVIVTAQTTQDGFEKLQKGEVDAIAFDESSIIPMVATSKDPQSYEKIGGQLTVEHYGIGIKKGRTDLVKAVNKALEKIKASGRWKEIYDENVKPFSGYSADPPTAY